jgi:hypothetical protein
VTVVQFKRCKKHNPISQAIGLEFEFDLEGWKIVNRNWIAPFLQELEPNSFVAGLGIPAGSTLSYAMMNVYVQQMG